MILTRRMGVFLLSVVVLGATITAIILARRHVGYVPRVLRIEPAHADPKTLLLHVSVDTEGTVYALENVGGKSYYHAYSPMGQSLWRVRDRKNADCNQAIVAFPGQLGGRMGLYSGKGGDIGWGAGRNIFVRVDRQGTVTSQVLDRIPGPAVEFEEAVSSKRGLCVVGMSEEAESVAARFDRSGKRLWAKIGDAKGYYWHATADADANLIASYGTGDGVFFAKYSPEGHLVSFRKAVSARDGASVVWMDAGLSGKIHALLRLHDTIVLRGGAESKSFLDHGSKYVVGTGTGDWDESGRDQDFVLVTLDHNGKLLRKKVVSHGAGLVVECAARNDNDEVYVVGNRRKVNSYGFPTEPDGAEVIKCNSAGDVIWSSRVALRAGSSANGVTLDDKGGIYIYGDGRHTSDRKYSGPSRPFIYKIADHR